MSVKEQIYKECRRKYDEIQLRISQANDEERSELVRMEAILCNELSKAAADSTTLAYTVNNMFYNITRINNDS